MAESDQFIHHSEQEAFPPVFFTSGPPSVEELFPIMGIGELLTLEAKFRALRYEDPSVLVNAARLSPRKLYSELVEASLEHPDRPASERDVTKTLRQKSGEPAWLIAESFAAAYPEDSRPAVKAAQDRAKSIVPIPPEGKPPKPRREERITNEQAAVAAWEKARSSEFNPDRGTQSTRRSRGSVALSAMIAPETADGLKYEISMPLADTFVASLDVEALKSGLVDTRVFPIPRFSIQDQVNPSFYIVDNKTVRNTMHEWSKNLSEMEVYALNVLLLSFGELVSLKTIDEQLQEQFDRKQDTMVRLMGNLRRSKRRSWIITNESGDAYGFDPEAVVIDLRSNTMLDRAPRQIVPALDDTNVLQVTGKEPRRQWPPAVRARAQKRLASD